METTSIGFPSAPAHGHVRASLGWDPLFPKKPPPTVLKLFEILMVCI